MLKPLIVRFPAIRVDDLCLLSNSQMNFDTAVNQISIQGNPKHSKRQYWFLSVSECFFFGLASNMASENMRINALCYFLIIQLNTFQFKVITISVECKICGNLNEIGVIIIENRRLKK